MPTTRYDVSVEKERCQPGLSGSALCVLKVGFVPLFQQTLFPNCMHAHLLSPSFILNRQDFFMASVSNVFYRFLSCVGYCLHSDLTPDFRGNVPFSSEDELKRLYTTDAQTNGFAL